jgi:hypothetical protein
MIPNCPECDRLWDLFVDATHSHLKLLSQQQISVIKQDSEALARLRQPVEESARNRQNTRRAFREHAASHGGSLARPV